MKIAITGAEGQIGSRLVKYGLEPLSCDITKRVEVYEELHRVKPDLVLHLAAQTGVDWCEENEMEALAVNVYGTSLVCQAASDVIGEGKVVLISSDQIFDGQKGGYSENDTPNPINVYGRTKELAEDAADLYDCNVIRISRCFDSGASPNSRSKDIRGYIEALERNEEIRIPGFFVRSYCHLDYMAEMFYGYALNFGKMPRVLHLGGSQPVSLHSFMIYVADEFGLDPDLIYFRGEVDGYAPRPHRTGLDVSRARKYGIETPAIKDSIKRMKNEGL